MRKIILLLFISFYSVVSSGQIFGFKDKPIPPYQDAVAVNEIREKMTKIDGYLLINTPPAITTHEDGNRHCYQWEFIRATKNKFDKFWLYKQ